MKVKLSQDEWNALLEMLSEFPFKRVAYLMSTIQTQLRDQLEENK